MGRMSEALRFFDLAIKIEPQNKFILLNAAITNQKMQRNEIALRLFLQVLEVDPSLREAHIKAAAIYRDFGDFTEV